MRISIKSEFSRHILLVNKKYCEKIASRRYFITILSAMMQWRTERYKCLCDANATMWGKGITKYGKACIIKLSKPCSFLRFALAFGLFRNASQHDELFSFLQCNNEPWSRLLHTPPHYSLAPQLHSNVLKIVVLFVKVEVREARYHATIGYFEIDITTQSFRA